jgi:hypothetical protein
MVVSKVTPHVPVFASLNHMPTGSEQVPPEVSSMPSSSITHPMHTPVMELLFSVLGRGADTLPGKLTPAKSLQTIAGQQYTIGFFQASAFSGPSGEASAFVDILWNGAVVSTINPGYTNWKFFSFNVIGGGSDVLAFHGGMAPAWSSSMMLLFFSCK